MLIDARTYARIDWRPRRRGVFAEGDRFFVGCRFQVVAEACALGATSESGSHKLVRVKTVGKVDATSAASNSQQQPLQDLSEVHRPWKSQGSSKACVESVRL